MARTHFDDQNCAIAQAAEVLGDGWTLLILREAFFGMRRFGDFERALGLAKNVLTARLDHLVEHGLMTKQPIETGGRRCEYVLTEKGFDLITVFTALRDWSNRWIFGEGNEPLRLLDDRTGKPVPPLLLRDRRGKPIPFEHLRLVPGPGADPETKKRLRND